MPEIHERVGQVLDGLEGSHGVSVLYACESGSRAWGFASRDSDFDVRFLYVHPPSWYLSVELEDKPDTIELPIRDELDVSGWDLRKALRLFRKSNPPLLEWLGSPIVYRESYSTASAMRQLRAEFYSPTACAYHYLHMARGNFREYLQGPTVWIKKYLYVLRPLLAIRWIEQRQGTVPTEFQTLLDHTVSDPVLRHAVDALLHQKLAGAELDRGPRIDAISSFLESELERHEHSSFQRKPEPPSALPLDQLFQHTLSELFGSGGGLTPR